MKSPFDEVREFITDNVNEDAVDNEKEAYAKERKVNESRIDSIEAEALENFIRNTGSLFKTLEDKYLPSVKAGDSKNIIASRLRSLVSSAIPKYKKAFSEETEDMVFSNATQQRVALELVDYLQDMVDDNKRNKERNESTVNETERGGVNWKAGFRAHEQGKDTKDNPFIKGEGDVDGPRASEWEDGYNYALNLRDAEETGNDDTPSDVDLEKDIKRHNESVLTESVNVPFEIVTWDKAKLVKGVLPMKYAADFKNKYKLGNYRARFASGWRWDKKNNTLIGAITFPDVEQANKFHADVKKFGAALPIEGDTVEAVRFEWKTNESKEESGAQKYEQGYKDGEKGVHDKTKSKVDVMYQRGFEAGVISKKRENIKNEGKEERGKRDGTGPYKGSAWAGNDEDGERKENGEDCPFKKDDVDETYTEADEISGGDKEKALKMYKEKFKEYKQGKETMGVVDSFETAARKAGATTSEIEALTKNKSKANEEYIKKDTIQNMAAFISSQITERKE